MKVQIRYEILSGYYFYHVTKWQWVELDYLIAVKVCYGKKAYRTGDKPSYN